MISKSMSRKSLAAFIAVAVLSVYSMVALAGAKAASGELSISGQVTVNGQKVISGGTLFSGSTIVTAENSSAIVSLSKMGRIELSPKSSLILNFTEDSVTGMLDKGVATVSTVAGVSVNLSTKDGAVVVDGSQATSFTVSTSRGNTAVTTETGLAELRSGTATQQIAAGENGTAGTPNPQTDDDDDDLSGGALAVLLLAVGGAVAGVLYAAHHGDEFNFGGNPIVISPSR